MIPRFLHDSFEMSGKTGIILLSPIISNIELSEGAITVCVSRREVRSAEKRGQQRERCYQKSYGRTPLSLTHILAYNAHISIQLKLLQLPLRTGLENGQNSFSRLRNSCQEKGDRSASRYYIYKFICCGQIYFLYLKSTILYIP